jgi:hypothetical protein
MIIEPSKIITTGSVLISLKIKNGKSAAKQYFKSAPGEKFYSLYAFFKMLFL